MTLNEKAMQVVDGSIPCEMSTVHTWHAMGFTDKLSSIRFTDRLLYTMFIILFKV